MVRIIIFALILIFLFAYVLPDNIVQQIPFAPQAKITIINLVNQAKGLISQITGIFKTSAINNVNNAKTDLKNNVNQQVNQTIDKTIPTPSQ